MAWPMGVIEDKSLQFTTMSGSVGLAVSAPGTGTTPPDHRSPGRSVGTLPTVGSSWPLQPGTGRNEPGYGRTTVPPDVRSRRPGSLGVPSCNHARTPRLDSSYSWGTLDRGFRDGRGWERRVLHPRLSASSAVNRLFPIRIRGADQPIDQVGVAWRLLGGLRCQAIGPVFLACWRRGGWGTVQPHECDAVAHRDVGTIQDDLAVVRATRSRPPGPAGMNLAMVETRIEKNQPSIHQSSHPRPTGENIGAKGNAPGTTPPPRPQPRMGRPLVSEGQRPGNGTTNTMPSPDRAKLRTMSGLSGLAVSALVTGTNEPCHGRTLFWKVRPPTRADHARRTAALGVDGSRSKAATQAASGKAGFVLHPERTASGSPGRTAAGSQGRQSDPG